MNMLIPRARRSTLALATALLFAWSAASAAPVVAPIADGGTHTYDQPVTKYQLFNAPAGITHPGASMSWSYNDANRPAGVSKAITINQIQASMAKWSAVCRISFVYLGETSTGFSTSDGTNVVGWDLSGLTAPTTGLTSVAWNGSNTIVDADIKLNAAYSATYTPLSNLDGTLTHEVGHALGLQHSDVGGQVMSGPPLTAYNGSNVLGSDDVAGCVRLYGTPGSGGPAPDTQAPSAPTGLTASAISTTQINLAWNASTDNVGVTSYKIFQGVTMLGTVGGTSASVTGLSPGTSYTFTVSACDAASNCSAQSGSASATTIALPVDSQAPTVPTGLVASPFSTSQINLAWNASTDNVGVTAYRVFQGGAQLGSVPGTTASVQGLSPGTLYGFTVSACDAAANCSAQSTTASASTLSPPPPTTCSGSQPANDQQILACPAGQSGSIVQSRAYSCVGTTWTPGAYQTISNTCANSAPIQSYQDMYWAGPAENGWGLTITQHADKLFLAWYIYDSLGNPLWVVMPAGQWNAAHTTYTGDLYIPSGSWYGNYQTGRFAANASVGSASLAFTSTTAGTLTYVVNGVSGSKSVMRQDFGRVDTTPITNYTDMWWGGAAENGWGVVLTQQYHNIFAAWYTYDTAGKTTWLVMPDGSWTSANTYSGTLYRTRGSPVVEAPYNASALTVTPAGTLALTFTDANTATMTYTVDGLTQTKSITRIPF